MMIRFGNQLLIAIIVVLVIFMLRVDYKEKQTEIYSVSLNSEVEGSFSIFFGEIDEEQYYLYYVKGEDGYLLKKTDVEKTSIVEDNEQVPHIKKWVCESIMCRNYKNPVLVVPEGTLKLRYNINQEEI